MLPGRRTPVRLQPRVFVSVFYDCNKAQIRATPRNMLLKLIGWHAYNEVLSEMVFPVYPTRETRTLKYTAFSLCL